MICINLIRKLVCLQKQSITTPVQPHELIELTNIVKLVSYNFFLSFFLAHSSPVRGHWRTCVGSKGGGATVPTRIAGK